MYFNDKIFEDKHIPNFQGEFDSCLNFYTKCIAPSPLYFAQNTGEKCEYLR